MSDPRQHIEAQLEAQRHTAAQASREVAELDVRSVRLTLLQWIANGETERARAFWAAYKKGK